MYFNDTLLELDLASNDLEDTTAARQFGEALGQMQYRKPNEKTKTNLQELNLSACFIGRKQMEELIEGLSRNRSLTALHFDDNELSLRGFRAVLIPFS